MKAKEIALFMAEIEEMYGAFVRVICLDILAQQINYSTIGIAQYKEKEEDAPDFIRAVAAWNPDVPPGDELYALIDDLLEDSDD